MKRASFLALCAQAAATGAEKLPRTDPSTLVEPGILAIPLEHGPGDVDAVLSGADAQLKPVDRLAETKDDYSPAQQNYVAVVFGFQIGGYDVRRVLFGFERGRLFHIELNPSYTRASRGTAGGRGTRSSTVCSRRSTASRRSRTGIERWRPSVWLPAAY